MLQTLKVPNRGYKLINKHNGFWQIKAPLVVFTGTYDQVLNYAVIELGFEKKEIELGRREMEAGFFSGAEFGFFQTFMWPFEEETCATYHTNH